MTKKIVFRCAECGAQSPRWQGRCPECGQWNTYSEERDEPHSSFAIPSGERPTALAEVGDADAARISSGSSELDLVLGGGIVPGSLVLLGGDPGIGKSTLLLQTAARVASSGRTVLYASGEESSRQIGLRAQRLAVPIAGIQVMANNNVEDVEEAARTIAPDLLIADSIQTLYQPSLPGAPGTVSQVRQCASRLMGLAKVQNVATFLVGHVTKEGSLAGPRVLEHMVDTVLYFEGERFQSFRVLRATKNRFGSTNEIGVFEMGERGLTDATDVSRFFVEEHAEPVSGSVLIATQEGSRTLIVEVQALISPTAYPTPQRVCTGIERQRLSLLLAVLEKRAGIHTSTKDVFVNVVGGVQVVEPAADLGVVLAVASAVIDAPLPGRVAVCGEVGLAGEVRRVTQAGKRAGSQEPLLDAYLYRSRVRCGRLACRCMHSDYRHEAWCLSFTEDGRSRTLTVPREWLRRVAKATDAYREARSLLRSVEAAARVASEAFGERLNARVKAGRELLAELIAAKTGRSAKGVSR
ncbi:MAG: DNA repair protein RadA [Candidatus Eisenbacteria bacterium]|nr:DNA repair protein RadA [Candidatus Eisenbacteria bacterium]